MKLPKVTKKLGSGLSKLETVRKVVLGVAMATTVSLGGALSNDAMATVPAADTQATEQGALLLTPSVPMDGQVAWHSSHSSHYSHSSHRSHYSHYSSRY